MSKDPSVGFEMATAYERKRRTVTLSNAHWRAIRMRAIADDKTVGEVMEAVIDSAIVAGGPILYGDTPQIWRMRNAHEWLGGTELGAAAQEAFLRQLEDEAGVEHSEP